MLTEIRKYKEKVKEQITFITRYWCDLYGLPGQTTSRNEISTKLMRSDLGVFSYQARYLLKAEAWAMEWAAETVLEKNFIMMTLNLEKRM